MQDASYEQLARLEALKAWGIQNGVRFHQNVSIEVRPEGAALAANGPIAKGEPIVVCPSRITLSYLNTTSHYSHPFTSCDAYSNSYSTSPFPPKFMEQVKPHVIGRFFLMHQYNLGRESYWQAYIAALPQPDGDAWQLPAFWTKQEKKMLSDTNVGTSSMEMNALIDSEYEHAIGLLPDETRLSFPRLLYEWAFCIFTSRSFRPSLVIPPETLEVELQRTSIQAGTKPDDFNVLVPVFDLANHDPFVSILWDLSSNEGCIFKTPERSYEAGDQVYNNYGNKTNTELLVGYGFINTLPPDAKTHTSYVHLRKARRPSDAGNMQEYLVSLQPITEGSSIRGHQSVIIPTDKVHVKGFEHFEQNMIWDILMSILQGEVDIIRDIWEIRGKHKPEIIGDIDVALFQVILGTYPFPNVDAEDIIMTILGVLRRKIMDEKSKLVRADIPTSYSPRNILIGRYRQEVQEVLNAAEASIAAAIKEQHPNTSGPEDG